MKMKLWKKAVALLLGSTLLFGMTACGDSSPTSSTADSGDTVKVGLLHSLSGTMAISETSVRDAELLAIEEINAAGGVLGKQIEAVEEDGASEPSKFAEKAQKLLQWNDLIEDDKYFTTLAFVEIDENGERKFSFARKPGADTQLRKEELDPTLLQKGKIFHFGSLSLTDEPAKSATLEAVHIAKDAGALISYDPNYRASLWRNEQTAVQEMKAVIPFADVMKVSDEESLLLDGKNSYEEAVEELLSAIRN